jgi:orotate phosphoribosyltransferase
MTQDLRSQLLDLLARESFFTRSGLTLASGRASNYYVDCKRTLYLPRGAYLAGELMLEMLIAHGLVQLGGMAAGALPVTDAVINAAGRRGADITGFFVRKEVKAHGLQQQIEGAFRKAVPTAMVDDTITTGGSTLQALEVVRAAGANVIAALAIVDRGEGAAEAFAKAGLAYHFLFNSDEIRAAHSRL